MVARAVFHCLVLSSFVGQLGVAKGKNDGEFISLTDANFDDHLQKHDRLFLQWYAPYCAECKALFPELDKVATKLKASGLQTKIAQADATVLTAKAGRYAVSGPILHYIVQGEILKTYEGKKSAEGIEEWLRNRERPDFQELTSESAPGFLDDAMGDSFALLAHVRKNSPRHKALIKSLGAIMDVLYDNDDINFGVVWLPSDADPKTDSKLVLRRVGFKDPDSIDVEFNGAWSAVDISSWVKKHSFAYVGSSFNLKYTPTIARSLGWKGVVVVCLGSNSEDAESRGHSLLRPLAAKYQSLKFTLCGDVSKLGEKEKEELVGDTSWSAFSGHMLVSARFDSKKRFVLEGEQVSNEASLSNFLSEARSGKLFARYKSEPSLQKEVQDDITVLTGYTFDRHVKSSHLDHFVLLTHPRCNHCEEFEPVWKKLAFEVRSKGWSDRGVIISRINMEKNECDEDVQEFPKLVLYPAVPSDKKIKKRRIFKPDFVRKISDVPVDKLLDFLASNAVNLENLEDEIAQASMGTWKMKRKKADL